MHTKIGWWKPLGSGLKNVYIGIFIPCYQSQQRSFREKFKNDHKLNWLFWCKYWLCKCYMASLKRTVEMPWCSCHIFELCVSASHVRRAAGQSATFNGSVIHHAIVSEATVCRLCDLHIIRQLALQTGIRRVNTHKHAFIYTNIVHPQCWVAS